MTQRSSNVVFKVVAPILDLEARHALCCGPETSTQNRLTCQAAAKGELGGPWARQSGCAMLLSTCRLPYKVCFTLQYFRLISDLLQLRVELRILSRARHSQPVMSSGYDRALSGKASFLISC